MDWGFLFFFNSILFGAGLAMDAFSVSLANGLHEPRMRTRKMLAVAGTFSLFQFLMPMIGWFFVHTLLSWFTEFEKFIPWIALILLSFIGGKMLWEGIRHRESDEGDAPVVGFWALMVQGVATSIDALSVGLDIGAYDRLHALVACLLIGGVTFLICSCGLVLGKTVGMRLANKASIFGGAILIFIGILIFVRGIF